MHFSVLFQLFQGKYSLSTSSVHRVITSIRPTPEAQGSSSQGGLGAKESWEGWWGCEGWGSGMKCSLGCLGEAPSGRVEGALGSGE